MAGLVAIQTDSLFTTLILNGTVAEIDPKTSGWFIVSDLHTYIFTLYIYVHTCNVCTYLSVFEASCTYVVHNYVVNEICQFCLICFLFFFFYFSAW